MKTRLLIFIFLLSLSACRSYYQRHADVQNAFEAGQLDQAESLLEKDKRVQKDRNRLLYLFNMGVINHLQQDFERSNTFFNEADLMIEDYSVNYAGEALAMVSNQEVKPYKAEDFEPVMVHYYKALNYLNLKDYDATLVEAKRMNLVLNRLNDAYKDHKNRYQQDAFAHIIMGMAYEATGELNNAFIAYRNAYNVYIGEHGYFGLAAPEQLKSDILRTTFLLGFGEEHAYYKGLFKQETYKYSPPKFGEAVVLWHNGLGPVKDEWSINFIAVGGGQGYVHFQNEELGLSFPVYVGDDQQKYKDLMALKVIRVAFPKYLERPLFYNNAWLELNGMSFEMEKVEDINAIAFKTLQDRFVREMSVAMMRLVLKKLSEVQLQKQSEALGALATITNAVTEKADTRNWQTLPHSIYYARVPLQEGNNQVLLKMKSRYGQVHRTELEFIGKAGALYFMPYQSLEHVPVNGASMGR